MKTKIRRTIHLSIIRHLVDRSADSPGLIVMAMLLFLALLLGSFAVTSRGLDGVLSAVRQGSNRDVHDIAETGASIIINELNKEQNRAILVSGNTSTSAWSSIKNNCTGFSSTGVWNGGNLSNPTTNLSTVANKSWQDVESGDKSRQFRLRSVSFLLKDRVTTFSSPPSGSTDGSLKTLIRLTVDGKKINSDGSTSLSSITREYEVVPKCCKRSFGFNTSGATFFGADERFCLPINGKFASLIFSIEGGDTKSSNNTITITDDTYTNGQPTPVTVVNCNSTPNTTTSATTACINNGVTIGKNVTAAPIPFNLAIPDWPTLLLNPSLNPPSPSCLNTKSNNSNSCITNGGNKDIYLRINTSKTTDVTTKITQKVESCVVASSVADSALGACTSIANSCMQPDINTNNFYCRLSSIDASAGNIIVDTSNGTVFIYFDTSDAPASSNFNYVSTGNSTNVFKQVKCSNGYTNYCATTPPLSSSDDLNLYAYGSGQINLNGNGTAITMSIFAPNATVAITGGSQYAGRIWADVFKAAGNIQIQVPSSAPTWFNCSTASNPCPPAGTTYIDWVARSVSYNSSF